MAEFKFSELPLAGPLLGTEIVALSQFNAPLQSVQSTLDDISTFTKSSYIYGDGIDFTANTLSVDINTTNLKFDTGVLNTIQDINTGSIPTFLGQILNTQLNIQSILGQFWSPRIRTCQVDPPTVLPWGLGSWIFDGSTQNGSIQQMAAIQAVTLNDDNINYTGGIFINVTEGPLTTNSYECFDGENQRIEQFRRLENLVGYQSFQEQFTLPASQNVDTTIIGRTVVNDPVANQTLTLVLGDTLPDGATFDMLRAGTGTFDLAWPAGVSVNGVNGPGSTALPQQYDRATITKIKTNEYSFIEYSGSVGNISLQDAYDAGNVINLTSGKPFELISTVAGFVPPRMTQSEFDAIAIPDNGLLGWNVDTERLRVNAGTAGVPVYEEFAYVSDIPVDNSAIGEMHFQGNSNETVITAQGVPVQIVGDYVSGNLNNFTRSGGVLTYIGSVTQTFKVTATLSSTLNLVSANVSPSIAVDGLSQSKSLIKVLDGSASPGLRGVTVQASVILSTNNTVSVLIQNDDGTDNITVSDINCIVETTAASGSGGGSAQGLQDNYLVERLIDYTSSEPIDITIPDQNTALFDVRNTLNGVDGNTISYVNYHGKNQIGADFLYHTDSTLYRKNLNNSDINSAERRFDILIDGLKTTALSVNGGSKLVESHLPLSIISNAPGGPIGIFQSTTSPSVGQFIMRTVVQGYASDGTGRGHNVFIETAPDTSPTSYSTRLQLFLWENNFIKSYGDINASTGSTRLINSTTKNLDQVATLIDVVNNQKLLAQGVVPRTSYTPGVFQSVVNTFTGSQIIPENTMNVGDSVIFEIEGAINSILSGGNGTIRILFNGAPIAMGINTSTTQTGQTQWFLRYGVTMENPTTLRVSCYGMYEQTGNHTMSSLRIYPAGNLTFDPTIANKMDVEFESNPAASSTYAFIAGNWRMIKYIGSQL